MLNYLKLEKKNNKISNKNNTNMFPLLIGKNSMLLKLKMILWMDLVDHSLKKIVVILLIQ